MKFDLRPMLATLTDKPFDDPDWIFETKWDGFRVMAVVERGLGLALFPKRPRSVEQISIHLRGLARDLASSGVRRRARGARCAGAIALPAACRTPSASPRVSSIACSISSISTARTCATGPWSSGKRRSRPSCRRTGSCITAPMSWARASPPSTAPSARARKASWPSSPAATTTPASARANGSRSRPPQGQEVVIVGFTAPRRSRQYFGSLRARRAPGRAVGDMSAAPGPASMRPTLKSIHGKLVPLITETKPIAAKVPDEANTTWVQPKLVGEVKFTEWTVEGRDAAPGVSWAAHRQEGHRRGQRGATTGSGTETLSKPMAKTSRAGARRTHQAGLAARFHLGRLDLELPDRGRGARGRPRPEHLGQLLRRRPRRQWRHRRSSPAITITAMREDIALMRSLGVQAYRFSVAWPRVLPHGRGAANEPGLAFYDRLIDALLAADIEPWLCLYHWDLPQALDDLGGWTNRDAAGWFADYAALIARRYGDRVKRFATFNEPSVFTLFGYGFGDSAPGDDGLASLYPAIHHVNLAHGAAASTCCARWCRTPRSAPSTTVQPCLARRRRPTRTPRATSAPIGTWPFPTRNVSAPIRRVLAEAIEPYVQPGRPRPHLPAARLVRPQPLFADLRQGGPGRAARLRLRPTPPPTCARTPIGWPIDPGGVSRHAARGAARAIACRST